MERNRKKLYMILGISLCIISVITIAYAALSTAITIQFSNVTQTQQTWSVTITPGTCTMTSTNAGNSGTSASCSATANGNTVTFSELELSKPDDKCDCVFTITNAGTIKAKLSSLAWTNPTTLVPSGTTCTKNGGTMTCGNIVYTVTTDGSTVLTTSNFGTLNGGSATKTIHVSAKSTALATAAVKQTNAKLALAIGQY